MDPVYVVVTYQEEVDAIVGPFENAQVADEYITNLQDTFPMQMDNSFTTLTIKTPVGFLFQCKEEEER